MQTKYYIVTLQESSSIVRKAPGQSDGAGGDLAHSDSRRHGGLHHLQTVADGVLAVEVLHGAHHAGQVLLDGGDQQGPVVEDLRVENVKNVQTQCSMII